MAGQAACHLLAQAHTTRAPWPFTTAVSFLPVLVLGMGTALAHLLHADGNHNPAMANLTGHRQPPLAAAAQGRPGWIAQAQAAAARLQADGRQAPRRALRECGIRGSNAHLAALARIINENGASAQPPCRITPPGRQQPPRHDCTLTHDAGSLATMPAC